MARKIVHIVGTGTVGAPLIGVLLGRFEQLGIEEISFQPNLKDLGNKAFLKGLSARGAKLCVSEKIADEFVSVGCKIDYTAEEAFERAAVIIDCSPDDEPLKNKTEVYSRLTGEPKFFIAQTRAAGFGLDYAYDINDEALQQGQVQFVRIVSCNAHNIAALIKTLAFDENGEHFLDWGRFVCIRRASDISEPKAFIPAPQISLPKDDNFGTYQAHDAASLFRTIGIELDLFSSSMKVNTQYLHTVHFDLKLKRAITLPTVINKLESNPLIALTNKTLSSLIFSFARDMGFLGRIINQSVVSVPSLTVKGDNEIMGFCFSPQDGNSLLSSIAAAVWYFYPHSFREKLQNLNDLVFGEI